MAKEKIKIFELDIDVDAAIQSQSDLKDTLDASREALKQLKKQGDTSSQQYVELEASVKRLSSEYNSAQTQLGKMLELQGKEIKTVKQGEAALTIINKEWSKQAALFGENSEEADKLARKHAELKDRTNTLRKSIGDTSTNIGNYAEGMKEALGQSTLFGRATAFVTDVMSVGAPLFKAIKAEIALVSINYKKAMVSAQGYSGAQKAAAVATALTSGALRILKVALIATGIGAIIVVLGSLIAYFSQTQEGINKVNRVLTPLKEVFGELKGAVQEFGAALAGLFSGGTFKAFFKDIGDAGDKVKKSFDEAWQRGKEIETVKQNLSKTEAGYIMLQAKLRKEFEEQKKLSDDMTQSTDVREKAALEAIRLQKDISTGTIERIKQEGQILKLKMLANDTSDEEKAALATKLAEIDKALEEEAAKTTEAQNKLNSIRKEGADKQAADAKAAADAAIAAQEKRIAAAKAATEAAISESKTRLEIFIEENEGKAKSLAESIEIEEQVRDKRIAILKEELEAKKLTESEYELEKLKIKNEFLDQEAALTQEYAQKEIEAEKERLAQRQEREYLEKQRKITDLENKRAVEAENFEIQMEIEKQRLEIQRQQELAEAEKTGADKALINKKYAKIEEDINYQKESAKRQQAANTFGGIAELLGKQTAAGKAAAIAQATINTYQGVTEVWRSPTILPEPFGTIQKIVSTGVVLGSGLSAVKKITSTNANVPTAAKGATLRGPSHAGGGVNLFDDDGNKVVNAEGDENIYVVNKRASGLINSLSYINQATGGIPLSRSTTFAAAGGMIQKGGGSNTMVNQQGIDYEAMAQSNARAMSNVKIFTAVTDINDGQGNYAQVVNGANV